MIADLYEPLTDPGFRKAVFDALGERRGALRVTRPAGNG